MRKNVWIIPASVIFIALFLTGCNAKTVISSEASGTSDISESTSHTVSSDALEQQLKSTLDYNSANSTASILYFHSGDFENNGQTEAFAYVGDPKSVISETQTVDADIWYIEKNGTKKILEGKGYVINPVIAIAYNKKY